MNQKQTRQTNKALQAARRIGFVRGDKWTRDEVWENAAIIVAFTAGFTVIGLWLVEKLMPGGGG